MCSRSELLQCIQKDSHIIVNLNVLQMVCYRVVNIRLYSKSKLELNS